MIEIDVSKMDINESLHITAIQLPEGVRPAHSRARFHHRLHRGADQRGSKKQARGKQPLPQHPLWPKEAVRRRCCSGRRRRSGCRCRSGRRRQKRLPPRRRKEEVRISSLHRPLSTGARDGGSFRPSCMSLLCEVRFAYHQKRRCLLVGLGNSRRPSMRATATMRAFSLSMASRVALPFRALQRSASQARPAKARSIAARCNLLKPLTYMNLSGDSVGPAARFYKIPLDEIVVAHDEMGSRSRKS